MLSSGTDEPQVRRHHCRQMTRVLKILIFSQLEPFAKLRNWIDFSKCSLDHFSMPFTKMQSKSDFVKFHFSRFLTGSLDSGHEKIFQCNVVGPDLPSTNVPSVCSKTRLLPHV